MIQGQVQFFINTPTGKIKWKKAGSTWYMFAVINSNCGEKAN